MKEGSAWIEPGVGEETQQAPLVYPKANVLHRFIAKFIDLLIVVAFYELPLGVGFIAGLTYLLLADGFGGGRSPGKQMIGLCVVLPENRRVCSFKESIIRNFPLAVAYLFVVVPYVGWLFTVLLFAIELLLVIGNGQGLRVGDEIASTQVFDHDIFNLSKE